MARDEAYKKAELKIEAAARDPKVIDLNLSHMKLTKLPDSLGYITRLKILDLSNNRITTLPESMQQLTRLQSLDLAHNRLKSLPESLGRLTQLRSLNLAYNKLTVIPDWIGNLRQLRELDLGSSNSIGNIGLPGSVWVLGASATAAGDIAGVYDRGQDRPWDDANGGDYMRTRESVFGNVDGVTQFFTRNPMPPPNEIEDLPASLAQLERLEKLNLDGNPLNPELAAAYKQGLDAIKMYLRTTAISGQITLNEAKLLLVGEGEVGKTCLVDALLGDPWREHDTTHGIQIKPIKLTDPETQIEIILNGWDFGGQRVYRPTHQLFFSAPAAYLVVWKPREGSQQGFVKEWIQLVKRREPSAKVIVVATHGGPQQRQPDIDRQELWHFFGKDTIIDFFQVESKPDKNGERRGIEELKHAIARVTIALPEVGRSVPRRWQEVRNALAKTESSYLPLNNVLDLCHLHKMNDEEARLFVTIEHRLGRLIHYQHDPTLRDIVVLKPDWLATAISYVLDDEETRTKHGLVSFSRLSHLWNDPARPAEDRYHQSLHPVFLRLMERFDLSYRVADPYARNESDPLSLIGQLVPDVRPSNLAEAWGEFPSAGDIQQTQICRIVDANNGQSANAEGLFYQLIVRLHKYSLGRLDYKDSVHWQRGLVLEDNFKGRAFLEHIGNDVRITVRSPYPEGLLGMLTREVKFLVESFWEGLRCDVMVPCIEPCGKHMPGTGLFEVEILMSSKRKGKDEFPCSVCGEWQNIDSLLHNSPAAAQQISLVDLQFEFAAIKDKLDENNVLTRRILSQVDKTYIDLLQVLTDEAKEGPRLFSFFPLDRSNFNPREWIRANFRLVLWCEHSRLPLPVLNGAKSTKGVYDLDLDREWFKKAGPYLKFLTGTLGMVLPVASSSVKLAVDETVYKLIEEQLDFGKSMIDAVIGETAKISDFLGTADSTHLEHGVATRAVGSTLRELHALLKAKDPGFGGLVRVMNKRQEFLWVHEKFAGEYE